MLLECCVQFTLRKMQANWSRAKEESSEKSNEDAEKAGEQEL